MTTIETARAAQRQAERSFGTVQELEPIAEADGTVLGWTFLVPSSSLRHGWVLSDGRVCHATETYRADAETCGRLTAQEG